MKGLDAFVCEFQKEAELLQCKKLPDDLERVFRESPRGVREYYANLETGVPSCLESAEIEHCQSWSGCRVFSECVRRYVGRVAAGWMWSLQA